MLTADLTWLPPWTIVLLFIYLIPFLHFEKKATLKFVVLGADVGQFPISLYYCTRYDCAMTIESYLITNKMSP